MERAWSGDSFERKMCEKYDYKEHKTGIGFYDSKVEGVRNIPEIYKKYEKDLTNLKVTGDIDTPKCDAIDKDGFFIELKNCSKNSVISPKGIMLCEPHSKIANVSTELCLDRVWGEGEGMKRWNDATLRLFDLMTSDYWSLIKWNLQTRLCSIQVKDDEYGEFNLFLPEHLELFWNLSLYTEYYRILLMVRVRECCHFFYR